MRYKEFKNLEFKTEKENNKNFDLLIKEIINMSLINIKKNTPN